VGASSWESFSGYLLSHGQSLALDESHLYAEDPRDPDALQTALDNKAVLPDSFPARKNVLVDTVKGRLYILSASRLAIYRYDFLPTKSGSAVTPRQQMRGELRVLPSHSGVTIILPGSARQATLFFHDTFGHVVDHVAVSGTNSVAWRPKDPGNGCFSVTTTIDGVSYEASFVAR